MKHVILLLITCSILLSCNDNGDATYINTEIGYWIISDKEVTTDRIGANHLLWIRNKRKIKIINVDKIWYDRFNVGDSILFLQHNNYKEKPQDVGLPLVI